MKWFQQVLIGLVAFLTLGIITPTHDIWDSIFDKDSSKQLGSTADISEYDVDLDEPDIEEDYTYIEDAFIVTAKELAYEKFGTKIGPKISEQFNTEIFPKMDEVLRTTVFEAYEEDKPFLTMSEKPAGNYSEKIFNVHHTELKKDIVRFHVRTEKRPQDGYFFNFHYHVADDQFENHHDLGEIYYAKDTPPKWMS